jgi:hypothetical protein
MPPAARGKKVPGKNKRINPGNSALIFLPVLDVRMIIPLSVK